MFSVLLQQNKRTEWVDSFPGLLYLFCAVGYL